MNPHNFPVTQREPEARMHNFQRRGRYRASRCYDGLLDIEDEDPYAREEALDSFDEQILQLPYPNRQHQAELGQARLSFPPNSSRCHDSGFYSQSAPSTRGLQQQDYDEDDGAMQYQRPGYSLPQYTYTPADADISSDSLLATSSPAFRAGQRRAENHRPAATEPRAPTRVPSCREEANQEVEMPRKQLFIQRPAPQRLELTYAPPVVQGIPLVPISDLPDRLRALYPFPAFNAVQSKCFQNVFRSDDNFVLASPTGSGKTAILELAICRAFANCAAGQYKIIYQAPIKALCSERQRDWQKKFSPLGLNCVELTGDSDSANLAHVQTANIIVTTPEKWDSITRKWKDHQRLMRMIKLFLIDEVHMLKEDRGAILEAVVSRMKTIGTDVRFIALSATVPNLDDVASWLGKHPATPYSPANSERFGEEFRPVKLRKHVCGYSSGGNDFAFDKILDNKLPDVISKYSERKPIMIFCMTRKSAAQTAKLLANWHINSNPQQQYWSRPPRAIKVRDNELSAYVSSGVAFHHAGLDVDDRLSIEKGFLEGNLSVICCTSTLAIGVNLPCHFVIIKNTVAWTSMGAEEYSDLEIMQMIGRAGRPQFDNSAIAVIMTRQMKVRRYETMVSGQEVLESKLHHGLIEHLNAEIGLGTINDLDSARTWLSKTFLYVRLKKNPTYYKLEGARSGQLVDEKLDYICLRDLSLLKEAELVVGESRFRCTEFGEAMARYYVGFQTMQLIVGLQPKAQISEILSALSQAVEFKDLKFRSGEKPLYKALNTGACIRFPIPVNLDIPAHKVSLIIQSVLGGADMPWDKDVQKHKTQYQTDVATVFRHIQRLIRCIADCQISVGDSVAVMNALLLQRSLQSQAWDDGPMHMRQIPSIGIVAVRKLVNAGIRSIEELEFAEPHHIEMALGRNPPFGLKLLEHVKAFPKLRVSVQTLPNTTTKIHGGVKVQCKVDFGFLNEKPVCNFQKRSLYVCVLVESSDGRLAHFGRISGQKLGSGQSLVIPVTLTAPEQSVNCYVMCDDIAGTMREASVKPQIASSLFPATRTELKAASPKKAKPTSNTSKRRSESTAPVRKSSDEFYDDGLDDDDLFDVPLRDLEFDHIENYANPNNEVTRRNTVKNAAVSSRNEPARKKSAEENDGDEPKQLKNGKWACNHKCKDRTACKHMCCREGLDKPPAPKKPAKKSEVATDRTTQHTPIKESIQTKLQLTASKRKSSAGIQVLDLTRPDKKMKPDYAKDGPREFRKLDLLHRKVQKTSPPVSLSNITHTKPAYCYSAGGDHTLSFMESNAGSERVSTAVSTDYGDILSDGPAHFEDDLMLKEPDAYNKERYKSTHIAHHDTPVREILSGRDSENYSDDDSLLADAMIGLTDSQEIQNPSFRKVEDFQSAYDDNSFDLDDDLYNLIDQNTSVHARTQSPAKTMEHADISGEESTSTMKPRSQKNTPISSPHFNGSKQRRTTKDFVSAKNMVSNAVLRELKQSRNQVSSASISENALRSAKGKENSEPPTMESAASRGNEEEAGDVGPAPDPRLKDFKPWFLAEFGDIVELVDE